MKLTEIKLAGFKSFVDPTTVKLPSNLIGVVGPNGCGKSNIIDAVRWVMGESSAKHLRGESMADVIFNGSNSRKPVGQAFIELVFDNSDGTVGGQYASFSEISVKRLVTRDGTSNYYLNGAKCRKRDITQVFLGTGLGPRSYSIIEQGMISRLIEAKPEELRVFLEEAAGISKYKERRRETENRIKHTRENLDRLNDLREEVDKLLTKLQRQAKTAEKYKEFKQDERRLKAELLVLKLRDLSKEIETEQLRVSEKETRLEESIAQTRAIEAAIEKDRQEHHAATDKFNEVQGKYYGIGGDIARKEQAIQHSREMRKKQESDLQEVLASLKELQGHISDDEKKIASLKEKINNQEPEFEKAKAAANSSRETLFNAEQNMQEWQQQWDDFSHKAAEPSELAKVERIRIEQFEKQSQQNQQRVSRLSTEKQALIANLTHDKLQSLQQELQQSEQQQSELQEKLDQLLEKISERKENIKQLSGELDEARDTWQEARAELISLEALQQAALNEQDEISEQWIGAHGLAHNQKLLDVISVDPGWEQAVEIVLGKAINAICIDNLDQSNHLLSDFEVGSVSFLENNKSKENSQTLGRLSEKVKSELDLDSLLASVYYADDLDQALSMRANLQEHESIISKQGVWLGKNWLKISKHADSSASVLERKQRIEDLKMQIEEMAETGKSLKQTLEASREHLQDDEIEKDELQATYNQSHQNYSKLTAQTQTLSSQLQQTDKRLQEVEQEIQELDTVSEQIEKDMAAAQERLDFALQSVEQLEQEREDLQRQKIEFRQQVDDAKAKAEADAEFMHQLELENQANISQLKSTEENLVRMTQQTAGLDQRNQELAARLEESSQPIKDLEAELQTLLDQRVIVENELNEARKKVDEFDNAMRQHELDRSAAEQKTQEVRTELESLKMSWQEVRVRRKTVEEQFNETGYGEQELMEYLPELANSKEWQTKVSEVEKKIERLGAINLAAIEEYEEQLERKKYLDSQYGDVSEALATLEDAIRKIDKETKDKFKETFDKVNDGLKNMFPRLFGGGQAYLELTEEDLLNAGVTIMARPPGKRNSTIHLLSGGEKALTAVAMVFSIFLLNPSPFCMLDEVDAPLDDANVGRFCDMVKEMSEQVQFIFITHNKITMSIANQLSGVTMQEPGVSRLVAVDVNEAVKLAAV